MLDKNVLADQLEKIDSTENGLTPEAVVRVASDPDNPLHSQFEWDDKKAGHMHRLQQARSLIKRVKIITPAGNLTPKYVSVEICQQRQYEPLHRVVQDQPKFDFVLKEGLVHIEELSSKIEALADLSTKDEQVERAHEMRNVCKDLRRVAELIL